MKKCLFLMLMFISMGVVAQKPYKVFWGQRNNLRYFIFKHII